jgi:DNA adenine methylase
MGYPGNKATTTALHQIINLMPPHEEYIEAFLGSGGILRTKRPARRNWGFELDPDVAAATRRELPGCVSLLADTRIVNGNGLDFLEAYACHAGQLVYADPPYLLSTRRSGAAIYKHEWSERDHVRLLTWADRTDARVIISGYDSALYRQQLSGPRWEFKTFLSSTRRGVATECLWYNFPRPEVLHDYRFLGNDFRERERIRRVQRRWASRLERMPLAERQALAGLIAGSTIAE